MPTASILLVVILLQVSRWAPVAWRPSAATPVMAVAAAGLSLLENSHVISQSIMHPLHATPAQHSSMQLPLSSPPPASLFLLLLLPTLFPLLACSATTAAIEPTGWSFFTIGDWVRAPAVLLLVPPSRHMHSSSPCGSHLRPILPRRRPLLLLFDKALRFAPTALTSPPYFRTSLFLSSQGSGKQNQSQVAATMGMWGEIHQPHFVVALGKERGREGKGRGGKKIQLRLDCRDG